MKQTDCPGRKGYEQRCKGIFQSGLVLFFAPSCRIARDTSWAVWGHGKDQWVAVHVWLSIACLVASIIHIYLNWTVLTSYFKSKIHKGLAFRTEWVAALAICVVLYAGSVRGVAPFSSLMVWKETFKHGAPESRQGWRGGRLAGQQIQNHASRTQQGPAGGGMGQKTLRQFCSDEGIQLSWAIAHLRNQGLAVRDTMTVREIADAVGVHPREIRAVFQAR
ncbi:MAG: DUF4405 domain-containing protein [Planctomycetota bacterium]